MIVIGGTIRVAAGRREEVMAQLRDFIAEVRKEPGCIEFSFAVDVNDDDLFRVFEIYKSTDDLTAHARSPHFKAWRAGPAMALMTERNLTLYEISGSKAL